MTTFTTIDGSSVTPKTRADLMKHRAFAALNVDSAGSPCVFENSYTCQSCTSEQIDWTDDWSCGCDDDCPHCGESHSPHTSAWIGPGTDQPLNPDYVLWRSLPEAGSPQAAQAQHATNSNQLWPHGRDVLQAETLEDMDAAIRACMGRRATATILAALRFWQRHARHFDPEMTIATDNGEIEPLTAAEINRLCERINLDVEADFSF